MDERDGWRAIISVPFSAASGFLRGAMCVYRGRDAKNRYA